MTSRHGCTGILSLGLASLWLAVGCGGESASNDDTSHLTGGSNASSSSPARNGGASSAVGGARATSGLQPAGGNSNAMTSGNGGTTPAIGGQPSTSAVAQGGTSTIGASGNGGKSAGGKSATGGNSNNPSAGKSNGGSTTIGGKSGTSTTGVGGISSAGTTNGSGVAFAGRGGVGGKSSAGGTASSGGVATGGNTPGGSPALNSFCQGNDAKVEYSGEVLLTPATTYESNVVMDCCNAYGINLHAQPQLDFDFAVETIWSAGGTWTAGLYNVDDSAMRLRGLVRSSTDATSAALSSGRVTGWGEALTSMSQTDPWYFRFCFEVVDPNSPLLGTRLYVPKVGMLNNYKYRSRFELYLLKDESVTPLQAKDLGPPWAIADRPILDLGPIAYVSRATNEVGLSPGAHRGQTFVTQVGGSNTVVRPFVVVADGVQIYLGTVGTMASAAAANAPVGPVIYLGRVGDNGFTIEKPMSGTDPRNDDRIWTVLSETSRLIP